MLTAHSNQCSFMLGQSRTAQLVFQTAFCSIALIGFLASLGLFRASFEPDFYVYFTNLSNYFCMAVMAAELWQTLQKQENSFTSAAPMLKFFGVLLILMTFFVFHILLAGKRTLQQNLSVSSILLHFVLPILYVADWLLFYQRGQVKWFYPLVFPALPALYLCFIFLRAWLMKGQGRLVYPYFFLDASQLGWLGVLRWIVLLFIVFLTLGEALYAADRLASRRC